MNKFLDILLCIMIVASFVLIIFVNVQNVGATSLSGNELPDDLGTIETVPDEETDNIGLTEEVTENEIVENDTGEIGRSDYMDSEFADSLLNYMNLSLKLHIADTVFLTFITALLLALLIIIWFV